MLLQKKVKNLLMGYGVEKPVYVIPTGIEREMFAKTDLDTDGMEIRRKFGIPEENTVLISVGRLAKEKTAVNYCIRFPVSETNPLRS